MLLDIDIYKTGVGIDSIVDRRRTRGRRVEERNRGEALGVEIKVLGAFQGYLAGRVNPLHGSKLRRAERRCDVVHDVYRSECARAIGVVRPNEGE